MYIVLYAYNIIQSDSLSMYPYLNNVFIQTDYGIFYIKTYFQIFNTRYLRSVMW